MAKSLGVRRWRSASTMTFGSHFGSDFFDFFWKAENHEIDDPYNTLEGFCIPKSVIFRHIFHWFFNFFTKLQKRVWSLQFHRFNGFWGCRTPFDVILFAYFTLSPFSKKIEKSMPKGMPKVEFFDPKSDLGRSMLEWLCHFGRFLMILASILASFWHHFFIKISIFFENGESVK